MDPAFPDIVGGYSVEEVIETEVVTVEYCANDNLDMVESELSDPFFMLMARRELAASRLW